jgi:phage baseplate assembly protein W
LGRTARTGDEDHIRDMVEQFLFTNPGERVNRPDFGSGLLQLVFNPNSPEVAVALADIARAGLQRWLGDVIDVQQLAVDSEDSLLRVAVSYSLKGSSDVQNSTFSREVGP